MYPPYQVNGPNTTCQAPRCQCAGTDNGATDKWTQLRERYTNTPELKERYERNKQALILMRQMLMEIDAEREHVGLSKAELARQIGANPSVVRRLFSAKASNPTLRTVLDLLNVLDIGIALNSGRQNAIAPNTTSGNVKGSIRQKHDKKPKDVPHRDGVIA